MYHENKTMQVLIRMSPKEKEQIQERMKQVTCQPEPIR